MFVVKLYRAILSKQNLFLLMTLNNWMQIVKSANQLKIPFKSHQTYFSTNTLPTFLASLIERGAKNPWGWLTALLECKCSSQVGRHPDARAEHANSKGDAPTAAGADMNRGESSFEEAAALEILLVMHLPSSLLCCRKLCTFTETQSCDPFIG